MTSARYRVTINGFKVNTETWDHALEVDGKRDEVFISYRTSLTNPRGDVLFVADDLSAVMVTPINIPAESGPAPPADMAESEPVTAFPRRRLGDMTPTLPTTIPQCWSGKVS